MTFRVRFFTRVHDPWNVDTSIIKKTLSQVVTGVDHQYIARRHWRDLLCWHFSLDVSLRPEDD
ncbi:hypothetical protein EMIT0P100_120182 [Pseudomonas sp. IT-P100]